ncbi:class I SAM-dependent methyltransferase [Gordonia sp. NPDC003950]
MNRAHLDLCASTEWAQAVREWIVPWTIDGVSLGERVVEFGPGPGRTTEVLAEVVPHLVAAEIDGDLAAALARRFADHRGIEVICADGAETGLAAGWFDTVVCMTMLHHVPGVDRQNLLFAEARRVVSPTGVFIGSDSLDGPDFRALHTDDVCVPVSPDDLVGRLCDAGFASASVETNEWSVRFRAYP